MRLADRPCEDLVPVDVSLPIVGGVTARHCPLGGVRHKLPRRRRLEVLLEVPGGRSGGQRPAVCLVPPCRYIEHKGMRHGGSSGTGVSLGLRRVLHGVLQRGGHRVRVEAGLLYWGARRCSLWAKPGLFGGRAGGRRGVGESESREFGHRWNSIGHNIM